MTPNRRLIECPVLGVASRTENGEDGRDLADCRMSALEEVFVESCRSLSIEQAKLFALPDPAGLRQQRTLAPGRKADLESCSEQRLELRDRVSGGQADHWRSRALRRANIERLCAGPAASSAILPNPCISAHGRTAECGIFPIRSTCPVSTDETLGAITAKQSYSIPLLLISRMQAGPSDKG
jgi:hypothetical protein